MGDIQKPDEICLPTFAGNFQNYFYIHQSSLLNINDLLK